MGSIAALGRGLCAEAGHFPSAGIAAQGAEGGRIGVAGEFHNEPAVAIMLEVPLDIGKPDLQVLDESTFVEITEPVFLQYR